MKIRFHHWLAIFIVTLFTDVEVNAGGLKIRPIDVFLLIAITLRAISGIPLFKPLKNPVVYSIYIFLSYIFINSLTKVTLGESVKETIQLFEFIILMFMIAEGTNTREKRVEFLNILLAGTGIIAFYAAYYNISSSGHFAGFKELDSPKHSFAFFALLSTIRYFTKTKKSYFDIFLIIVSYAIVLLGGERKGWAGLIVALTFFLTFQVRYHLTNSKLNTLLTLGFAFLILAVVGITIISNPEFKYFNRQITSLSDVTNYFGGSEGGTTFQSSSDRERIFMFNYGLLLFSQNPFFGIGIDQFIDYVTAYSGGLITHDAHNFYLKILDEEGLAGLFLFFVVLALLFFSLFKLSKLKNKTLAQDAQTAMCIFLLGSVVNFFLAGKALSWLYLVQPCGMMLAIKQEAGLENLQKNISDKYQKSKSLVSKSLKTIKGSFS